MKWACSLMVKQVAHNRKSLSSILSRPTSAPIAQWKEHRISTPGVGGSSPPGRTKTLLV